jgi:hypothetical protein
VQSVLMGLFVTSGGLLFFGWIILMVWLDQRHKERLRGLEQEERLRMLELGFAPQEADIARSKVEADRVKAVGAIGVASTLGLAAALAVVSFAAVHSDGWGILVPLTAWPAGALAIWLVARLTLEHLPRQPVPPAGRPPVKPEPTEPAKPEPALEPTPTPAGPGTAATGIVEKPTPR